MTRKIGNNELYYDALSLSVTFLFRQSTYRSNGIISLMADNIKDQRPDSGSPEDPLGLFLASELDYYYLDDGQAAVRL
jgi:hypothetical protein